MNREPDQDHCRPTQRYRASYPQSAHGRHHSLEHGLFYPEQSRNYARKDRGIFRDQSVHKLHHPAIRDICSI